METVNPYVFIVGCPRSGTTLLQRIVDAHPQIAITPESHWIPRLFDKRRGLTREGWVTPGLITHLIGQPEFDALGIEHEILHALVNNSDNISYADFVAGIFDVYGKARNKTLVGNKTPGFVRRLGTLHALWHRARFVHLIRDGRDVYLSTKHRVLKNPKPGVFDTWEESPATTAAVWWEWNVREGKQAASWLGPELYYEMHYESLVAHPVKECAALCTFLDLPYDDALLRFHEGQTKPRAARPITPGLRDWKTQMSTEEEERFEAAAGDLLDELGYSRAFPHPQPDKVELASRIRNSLAKDPRTRYGPQRKELGAWR